MAVKYGVFLARMQPVHNAHLFLVEKALEENEKVMIVLGSENKVDMLRNPYDISLRERMLRECLGEEENRKLDVVTLPDWSMESDLDGAKIWGRYFYYNVVSNCLRDCPQRKSGRRLSGMTRNISNGTARDRLWTGLRNCRLITRKWQSIRSQTFL